MLHIKKWGKGGEIMDRLRKLKRELKAMKDMHCLSFDLKETCITYYKREIANVERYGNFNIK